MGSKDKIFKENHFQSLIDFVSFVEKISLLRLPVTALSLFGFYDFSQDLWLQKPLPITCT